MNKTDVWASQQLCTRTRDSRYDRFLSFAASAWQRFVNVYVTSQMQVHGETFLYCHDNECNGMLPASELIELLKPIPSREGLLVLDGFGVPNDAVSQTTIETLCMCFSPFKRMHFRC